MAGDIFCKNCCGQIVGVRFCGWFTQSGLNGDAWIHGGVLNTPLQAYINNINAYDMSSIPPGYMRLLKKDGQADGPPFPYDPGTGALTGEFTDFKITPQFYETVAPCSTPPGFLHDYTAFAVFDPFFQGNPVGQTCAKEFGTFGCSLVTSSFIGLNFFQQAVPSIDQVTITHVVRCQVIYASSGENGALVDFDWTKVPFEPLSGGVTSNIGVCGNMPAMMPELDCTTMAASGTIMNIPIPDADLSSIPRIVPDYQGYFKAKYWFLGDTCSNIP